MKILLTGSTGFIGKPLVQYLSKNKDYNITCVQRHPSSEVKTFIVKDLTQKVNWKAALSDVELVIHTAARAHIINKPHSKDDKQYFDVNTDVTLELASEAAKNGVRRFIFLSSVKVNGEYTEPEQKFTAYDATNPIDAYGQSKKLAEIGLLELAKKTTMEVVIIRPPLVYGPDVKGNFQSLINIIQKQIPLPLKGLKNLKTFIGIDNLLHFIELCIHHPAAKNQIFLVGDKHDVSTEQLCHILAELMGGEI